MIHSTLHAARPDVLCAAHTHSIHGKAFSTLGIELDMLTQDTCAFYNVSTTLRAAMFRQKCAKSELMVDIGPCSL